VSNHRSSKASMYAGPCLRPSLLLIRCRHISYRYKPNTDGKCWTMISEQRLA
jgi:hypothetical protein